MSKRPDEMAVVERQIMELAENDWYISEEVIDALSECEYEIYCQECQEEELY